MFTKSVLYDRLKIFSDLQFEKKCLWIFLQDNLSNLPEIENSLAIFCMATYGEGDPTDNAQEFYNWLQNGESDLTGVKFAVSTCKSILNQIKSTVLLGIKSKEIAIQYLQYLEYMYHHDDLNELEFPIRVSFCILTSISGISDQSRWRWDLNLSRI